MARWCIPRRSWRQWHQWNQRKFEAQIDQRLQPLQERENERVASERMTQAKAEAMERMSKVIAPYKQLLPDWDTPQARSSSRSRRSY